MALLTGKRYTVSEFHVTASLSPRIRNLYGNLFRVAREELNDNPERPPRFEYGIFETKEEALLQFERFKPYMTTRVYRKKFADGTRIDVEFDALELGCLEGTGVNRKYTMIMRYIAHPEEEDDP